jgi:flagellar basal-body rod protein FlgB
MLKHPMLGDDEVALAGILEGAVMIVDPISMSETLQVLRKSLDSLSIRNEAIANNIANVDTPQYKRIEVTFQDQLKNVLDKNHETSFLVRTHPKHFPNASPSSLNDFRPDLRVVSETTGRNDGNNVDMNVESTKLAENTALYNSIADVTSRYISQLRHAVTEGKQ